MTARCLARHEVSAAYDYGQFFIEAPQGEDKPDDPADDLAALLDEALDGEGVAAGPHAVAVVPPPQYNSNLPVTFEHWNARPPDDTAEWQEVFEACLTVSEGGLWFSTATLDGVDLPEVPPGRYAIRISGRGFRDEEAPAREEPTEQWRLQLWLIALADAPPARRIAAWPR